jgi:hypothetical protein
MKDLIKKEAIHGNGVEVNIEHAYFVRVSALKRS